MFRSLCAIAVSMLSTILEADKKFTIFSINELTNIHNALYALQRVAERKED